MDFCVFLMNAVILVCICRVDLVCFRHIFARIGLFRLTHLGHAGSERSSLFTIEKTSCQILFSFCF